MKSNYYQGIREQVYSEGEGYRAVAGTNIFFNNQWFVGADASYNMLDYKANQYFQDFSLDAMIVRGYTGLAF
jgi:hypothetical protein